MFMAVFEIHSALLIRLNTSRYNAFFIILQGIERVKTTKRRQ